MTIFSLKCFRCSKTNCPKYLKCIYCHSLSCLDCINETNPNRLTYKIMKNDKNGIEQSIYCSKHCNKIGNICNDCGGYYSNLKKCHNCFILFCTDCQQRNMENIGEYMIPGDDEYVVWNEVIVQDAGQLGGIHSGLICLTAEGEFYNPYIQSNMTVSLRLENWPIGQDVNATPYGYLID